MSNTSALALGLGSGLGLWYLTKNKIVPARSSASSRSPRETAAPAASAPRNCAIHVDAVGLSIDGARTNLDDAVRRCRAAGRASVTIAKDAPASTCVALMNALAAAHVPPFRNAPSATTHKTFTLTVYPEGAWGPTKIVQWFRAEVPITWEAARDRLAAARILDPRAIGPGMPGYWILTTESRVFETERAKPLPGTPRNSELADQFTLVTYPEGVGGPKKVRWFYAERPILWNQALARLDDAGLINAAATLPLQAGYWILLTSPASFNEAKAEPLPRSPRPRGAAHKPRRYTTEGRRILRDGEPIVHVDRVDLGDGRYAISPHHADLLTERIVRLLNKHEARP